MLGNHQVQALAQCLDALKPNIAAAAAFQRSITPSLLA